MDVTRTIWLGLVFAVGLTIALAAWASRRKTAMYRRQLPRIYELRDLIPKPAPSDSYFRNLDESLTENPRKLKQYRDIENDLQGLDPDAWTFLKAELRPLISTMDAERGWQPLFDKLNQAKAYNYLKSLGYSAVAFIPPSSATGRRTPDLKASSDTAKALCEVKTINISEVEATRRHTGGVGSSGEPLSAGFFNKLASDLIVAKKQMDAYDGSPGTKRIAYVIVNFDDYLHEYSDIYRTQIDDYMKAGNPAPGLDVFFDIKPPFYTTMS
jgi:hypothetical protein